MRHDQLETHEALVDTTTNHDKIWTLHSEIPSGNPIHFLQETKGFLKKMNRISTWNFNKKKPLHSQLMNRISS